ncbi:glycerol-3-phosphate dehydrogenase [NAD(P)+] [Alphaproteobacteria bacterium]|nr:glycerol-3-phosphate dehydrogenase [NAD(P)+] [Alphaproteobacteria bacterium]
MKRIGVIGSGAWGSALAVMLARKGVAVTLWSYEREVAEAIARTGTNPAFLPGISLSGIASTSVLADAVDADALLLVAPAQFLRGVCRSLAPHLGAKTSLVICAKGIEADTLMSMQEVVACELPDHPLAILSGPTFAIEVARGLPTAVTLAVADPVLGERLVRAIGSPSFRPYLTDDLVGAELGGAVKNVLAIACGIVAGRRLGDNARAALITRGMAELTRLVVARGGRAATCMGLSGLGDLMLTASSTQSRNYSLGVALGEGKKLEEILASRRSVAEGVASSVSVSGLARKLGVDMPIAFAVEAMLFHALDVEEAIKSLLSRPYAAEQGSNGS